MRLPTLGLLSLTKIKETISSQHFMVCSCKCIIFFGYKAGFEAALLAWIAVTELPDITLSLSSIFSVELSEDDAAHRIH